MDFDDKRYVVGIDLGTTNSAVSYADLTGIDTQRAGMGKEIKVFKVPQLTGPGEFSYLSVLPSFLYIPGEYDVSKEALKHPWKKRERPVCRDLCKRAWRTDSIPAGVICKKLAVPFPR